MQRVTVVSSNIASTGYDEENHIVEVEFLNGRVFQYADVPKELYESFMNASSKGKFFYANFRKGMFKCTPIVEVKKDEEKKEGSMAVGTEETGTSK